MSNVNDDDDSGQPVDLNAQFHQQVSTPSGQEDARPIPTSFTCEPKLQFEYTGSNDGVDTNLLIFLHGRGDSEKPFAKLATSLRLPQTATLALRGPLVVPLLDDHEREWWNETDMIGMDVPNPDPTKAVNLLCKVIDELHEYPYSWPISNIHLFGFAQGGTLACECALNYSKTRHRDIGSVITIQGPLLSHSIDSTPSSGTKVLLISRQSGSTAARSKHQQQLSALQRSFRRVDHSVLPEKKGVSLSMPVGKAEWEGIMKFWSEHLHSRSAWERSGEVYEITGGAENIKTSGQTAGQSERASSSANIVKEGNTSAANAKSVSTAAAKVDRDEASNTTSAPSGLKRGFLSKGLS